MDWPENEGVSRRSFVRRVGMGLFAAVPLLRSMAHAQPAAAKDACEVQLCIAYGVCTGGNCFLGTFGEFAIVIECYDVPSLALCSFTFIPTGVICCRAPITGDPEIQGGSEADGLRRLPHGELRAVDASSIRFELTVFAAEEAARWTRNGVVEGVRMSEMIARFDGYEGTVLDPLLRPHAISLRDWTHVDPTKHYVRAAFTGRLLEPLDRNELKRYM